VTRIPRAQVERVEEELLEWKDTIEQYGVAITTDGWTGGNKVEFYNYMVVTHKGPYFHDAVDVSELAVTHDAPFIAEGVIKCIDEVGSDNVVVVITDGPTPMRNSWKIIEDKYPTIVCNWCADHVLDLLLEDIGKLPFFAESVLEARAVVKFINNHKYTLDLLRRKAPKQLNLLLPGETRFATAFIMIDRILVMKDVLIGIVSTDEYKQWLKGKKYRGEGKKIAEIVLNPMWWKKITVLADISGPIVNLLRVADGDIPSGGKIYHEMFQLGERLDSILAKPEAKRIMSIGELQEVKGFWYSRWENLHSILHSAAFALDVEYHYIDHTKNVELMADLVTYIDKIH
jgi:hypothetical protein